jgi:t-SNARE complex subunit (syntaxin)
MELQQVFLYIEQLTEEQERNLDTIADHVSKTHGRTTIGVERLESAIESKKSYDQKSNKVKYFFLSFLLVLLIVAIIAIAS